MNQLSGNDVMQYITYSDSLDFMVSINPVSLVEECNDGSKDITTLK